MFSITLTAHTQFSPWHAAAVCHGMVVVIKASTFSNLLSLSGEVFRMWRSGDEKNWSVLNSFDTSIEYSRELARCWVLKESSDYLFIWLAYRLDALGLSLGLKLGLLFKMDETLCWRSNELLLKKANWEKNKTRESRPSVSDVTFFTIGNVIVSYAVL